MNNIKKISDTLFLISIIVMMLSFSVGLIYSSLLYYFIEIAMYAAIAVAVFSVISYVSGKNKKHINTELSIYAERSAGILAKVLVVIFLIFLAFLLWGYLLPEPWGWAKHGINL